MTCLNCGFYLANRDRVADVMDFAPLVDDDAYVTFRSSGDGTCYVDDVPVQPAVAPDLEPDVSETFQKPPLGHRAFMASLRFATGASIFTVTLILAFFAIVFLKACTG